MTLGALGCALILACGSGSGGTDDGASSTGGMSGAGSGGTGGSESGGTSSTGGTASGGGTSGAGDPGSGGQSSGGSNGALCTAGERRCEAQQPQVCDGVEWADDGEPCSVPEACHEGTGLCAVASILLPGGPFLRSYDVDENTYNDDTAPATISSVRLDEYEVTVGQFRPFVAAMDSGWTPPAGWGKHAHLNGGSGLTNSGPGGGHEGGWNTDWNAELPATLSDWNDALDCGTVPTWTNEPAANELLPINCVNWYDDYAYCIWSGGFLPSEAEWNYAATGGDEQRMYAWGNTTPNSTRAVFGEVPPAPVGSKPAGRGRWGHADLTGNLFEFTLDWHADYVTPCSDCARLGPDTLANRVNRGGNYNNLGHGSLRTGYRGFITPGWRPRQRNPLRKRSRLTVQPHERRAG